ncbi:acylphosphatase [Lactobacillus sp. ESL0791]|uniref:acylphosphatase n=1 Tax=Lactobacillus sp. ESL0791 TaxID=2983234 RepID=UPI0023F67CC2|nr:acylphosphatase [Lactobacillus sp. ESL0791]MDF7639159.1 acylphosphatase [Lactobacillus sp. ESL0791]
MKFFGKGREQEKDNGQNEDFPETWQLTITGIVQGVGFRWSVQSFAQNLHLPGSVKNNFDGSVTVVLQADKNKVDLFIRDLPQNISRFAKITKIKKEKLTNVEKMHDFHVSY